jgi:hypothetical protein
MRPTSASTVGTSKLEQIDNRDEVANDLAKELKVQLIELTVEANQKHNEQQNQLQGAEAVKS